MTKVLALVEDTTVRPPAEGDEVVSAASRMAAELGGEVHALVVGGLGVAAGAESLGSSGARVVKVAAHRLLEAYHPDGYAEVVARVVRDGSYAYVFMAASDRGRDLAPRVAARLDVPLAQDVTAVSVSAGFVEFTRPIYAGKAIARVTIDAHPRMATLRRSSFSSTAGGPSATVESIEVDPDPARWHTEIESFETTTGGIPDVAQASIVVSGGRGMKGPENWHLLEELRSALGREAGLGASRAVVDAGWRAHGEQVGQTGKTVSPRLYLAIAISGAIQHLAGMRTSGTIVAINRDSEAPIFKVADYGIVGDAFEVVPRLTEEIRGLGLPG